ncbi:MAG: hypothetical protein ACK48X_16050, partial [Planctomycetota bacterium]
MNGWKSSFVCAQAAAQSHWLSFFRREAIDCLKVVFPAAQKKTARFLGPLSRLRALEQGFSSG